jgi:hypothetical protein
VATPFVATGAVEGALDEAVLRRLLSETGGSLTNVYGRRGVRYLLDHLRGYNGAAAHFPWVALADLDEAECAPAAARLWLPVPARYMRFRIAERAVEAWLMADRDRLASFLNLPPMAVPADPERLLQPKRAMVELARRSRNAVVRREMVPQPGSGHATGPAYTSRLIRFVLDEADGWRPQIAAVSSASLLRCVAAVAHLREEWSAVFP